MIEPAIDYARKSYYWRRWRERFIAYVERVGVPCQPCGGRGGEIEVVCDGQGPWYTCGYCEGTGRMTKRDRGQWLTWMRQEKQRKREHARLMLERRKAS